MLIVIVNAAWVVGSVIVLLAGTFPLTLLGVAFVIAQAVAVAALAALQWVLASAGPTPSPEDRRTSKTVLAGAPRGRFLPLD